MTGKAEVGDKVNLKGNTSKAMKFNTGYVKKIGHTNSGDRIYYVSRTKGGFSTPFLTGNIKSKRR